MPAALTRREFVKESGAIVAGVSLTVATSGSAANEEKMASLYGISLAEFSLHRTIGANELEHLDFTRHARDAFGIDAVEYWSHPFEGKIKNSNYLAELKQCADDHGIKQLLIMIDDEGDLGDEDQQKRTQAVENHYKWIEGARFLGCHSIRVNARSHGAYDDQIDRAADGLWRLAEFGAEHDINVIVENHGGLSSNGAWLMSVMKKVGLSSCGTLPDFGNFGDYDRYQGVKELMPFAKAVSAKSHHFDADGNETSTDYRRMMKIVDDAGYRGYVGIEYAGQKHSEFEGIHLTRRLLERIRGELSA